MRFIHCLSPILLVCINLQAVSIAELAQQNKLPQPYGYPINLSPKLTAFAGTFADLKKLLSRKNLQRAGIIAGALCLAALAVVGTKYYLLQSNPNANQALLDAAIEGKLKRAESALLKGANVNIRDSWGKTPLSWAVGSGNKALIIKLLCEGADPYAKDGAGAYG